MALTSGELRALTRLALTGFHGSQDIYTGLGWTAKREYLVYDAGTVLATNSGPRSPYTKVNDGWAICAIVTNANDGVAGGDWTFVYTISTDQDYAKQSNPVGDNGQVVSYQYLGKTWYIRMPMAYNRLWGSATDVSSDFPIFDWGGADAAVINGLIIYESTFQFIMQLAGVRRVK